MQCDECQRDYVSLKHLVRHTVVICKKRQCLLCTSVVLRYINHLTVKHRLKPRDPAYNVIITAMKIGPRFLPYFTATE